MGLKDEPIAGISLSCSGMLNDSKTKGMMPFKTYRPFYLLPMLQLMLCPELKKKIKRQK